jgi:hypothetical protein
MWRSSIFLGLLTLIGMVNCGDSAAQDGSRCCPISQVPACCMEYGGSSPSRLCGTVCYGMPRADYPGWERRIDENGCPFWWTPPDAPRECGGVILPEPRVDADAPDTRSDASADADAPGGDPDGRSDGDAPDADPDADPDATADGDARDDSDGNRCCPISPAPQCCMAYGGSRLCATVCDGMPWPDYPGWERRIDENGCPYWWTPPDAPPGCSAIPPEPRVDADAPDPRSDAPDTDAPSGDPDGRSDG